MKTYILFSQNHPDRSVEQLSKNLDGVREPYELIDADSRQGASLSELYDILDRPAVLVVRDDGSMAGSWQGSLPLTSEITALTHA